MNREYDPNRCPVCGMRLPETDNSCPVCGFPRVALANNSAEEIEWVMKQADEYRVQNFHPDATFRLTVYSNRENDDEIISTPEQLFLAEYHELKAGEVKWINEDFARLFGDVRMKLEIKDIAGRRKETEVFVRNPQVSDFWRIGIVAGENYSIRLLVGSSTQNCSSEPVYYLKELNGDC